MNNMENILEIAAENQKKAWKVIKDTNIIGIWESVGAEINLVGSLKTGLLMKNRDIDFHIYSAPFTVSGSFSAIAKLAENTRITHIEYNNLINTKEECIEWHAWYKDDEEQMWQIDMIHIIKDSFYDGYFEKVAERICDALTPETRMTILKLKFDTPDTEKISGIEYYQAVIRDKVHTYEEFQQWRKKQPVTGVIEWMP